MLGEFHRVFSADTLLASDCTNFNQFDKENIDPQLTDLLNELGGKSFNGGIYRVFSPSKVAHRTEMAERYFPKLSGRITCFSMDWLGRFFALDSARTEQGRFAVVMLEPGTGEVLEIPCNLESFHDAELIDYREEALAESFHKDWRKAGGATPNIHQCVGYKIPLFLGGADKIENLVLTDLEVYWSISEQLISKSRGLPTGSAIGKISIE